MSENANCGAAAVFLFSSFSAYPGLACWIVVVGGVVVVVVVAVVVVVVVLILE